MPTFAATFVASLAGWMLDGLFQPLLGSGVSFVLSAAGSTAVFFFARKWLIELRGA